MNELSSTTFFRHVFYIHKKSELGNSSFYSGSAAVDVLWTYGCPARHLFLASLALLQRLIGVTGFVDAIRTANSCKNIRHCQMHDESRILSTQSVVPPAHHGPLFWGIPLGERVAASDVITTRLSDWPTAHAIFRATEAASDTDLICM